jgi:hypothetical protein
LTHNNQELLPHYNLTQLFETKEQFVRLNHNGNHVKESKTLGLKIKVLKIPTEAVRKNVNVRESHVTAVCAARGKE